MRERLRTGEWDAWLCSLRACLPRAPPGLLERRLLQFLEWGSEAARDLRQPEFLRVLAVALSSFSPEVWESLLHDSTSPKLLMQRIREEVLARGLGPVGRVDIPREVWDSCVPDGFAELVGRQFSGIIPPSDEAVVMMRALRDQGLLFPLPPGSPGPNGGVFAIPKTEEKCSLIVNLVPLNEEMRSRPEKFSLPSVEVLALLAQVAQQGSSFFLPSFYARARCMRPVWDILSLPGGGGEELCMCHIDLSNCFWSLQLPREFWGAFRVSDGEGGVLAFRCLPFGWKYSPLLCQRVLEGLVADAGLLGVLVLIYLDDVLVVGRGRARVREQTARAAEALRRAGAVVSPKSTLEPVQRLVWLGKDIDLQGGEVRTAGNAWEALFAHWLRLSVGPCRVKRLQQFLGRAQWICRPGSGHSPHLSGVWAHVLWAPPRLPFTPVRLLKSMCVACVLARRQWSVVSLPRVVKRSPLVVYVDAALDAGEYRLGLFSMDVGSRSVVPAEQPPNQQCAEAAALLWGLKLILNVGVREAHLFGDNAAALVQFLRCKAKVGRKFQQSILKRFRYLWASCPGFTVYMHWVRGSHNPADPISRLSDNFNGDLGLAREVAARRVGDLWAFPDRRTVFLWTLGVPMGPFVLPHSWRAGLWSPGGGEGGAEFHEVFLQYRLEESVGAMT